MSKLKRLLGVLLTVVFIFSLSTNAFAAETPSNEAIYKVSFNQKADPNKIIKDPEKKSERRKAIKEGFIKKWKETKDHKAVEDWLISQGFIKIEAVPMEQESGVSIQSSNSNVSVPAPSVYYDPLNDEYSIQGNFSWNNDAWVNDISGTTVGNMGGNDGVAIWWEKSSAIRYVNDSSSQYLVLNSIDGYYDTIESVWDWDNYGIAIKAQDKTWLVSGGYDYNFDSGTLVTTVTVTPGTTSYLKTTYCHTYSSCALNSVSFGSSGVTFNISSSSTGWQKTNNPYSYLFKD
ncbi:MAG: hypothetical protein ACOY35_00005 [Bacillota bacterium]